MALTLTPGAAASHLIRLDQTARPITRVSPNPAPPSVFFFSVINSRAGRVDGQRGMAYRTEVKVPSYLTLPLITLIWRQQLREAGHLLSPLRNVIYGKRAIFVFSRFPEKCEGF